MLDFIETNMLDWINTNWVLISEIAAAFAAVVIVAAFIEKIRLNHFWKKACTGSAWAQRFPSIPRQRIRGFLTLFAKSFGFSKKRQLKFSPNDKIIDVYRALYPLKAMPDNLEIEAFVKSIRKHYRINLAPHWHENITLGEVFERTVFTHSLHTIIAHA